MADCPALPWRTLMMCRCFMAMVLVTVLLLPGTSSDQQQVTTTSNGLRGRINSRVPRLPLTTTTTITPRTKPILSALEASSLLNDHAGHASTTSFLHSLLRAVGLGSLATNLEKISDGIESALPWPTVTDILEKVSLSDWLKKYNEAYNGWRREFNMGYCYLEYSIFHMINRDKGRSLAEDSPRDPPKLTFWDIYSKLVMSAQNGGDSVTQLSNVFQSVLPMVSELAKNPNIQEIVGPVLSSLFSNKTPPVNINDNKVEEDYNADESDSTLPLPPPGDQIGSKPQQNFGGMILSLVQTYLQHYLSSLPGNALSPQKPQKPSSNLNVINEKNSTVAPGDEDIVEAICDVAKPFFISFFGVVPDISGVGRLGQVERKDRNRKRIKPEDILIEGDDYPSLSISLYDIFMGENNALPSNSNPIYNFGNRVAYAFSVANDATQGLYCMKQYSVNKMWDWFRIGVQAVVR